MNIVIEFLVGAAVSIGGTIAFLLVTAAVLRGLYFIAEVIDRRSKIFEWRVWGVFPILGKTIVVLFFMAFAAMVFIELGREVMS